MHIESKMRGGRPWSGNGQGSLTCQHDPLQTTYAGNAILPGFPENYQRASTWSQEFSGATLLHVYSHLRRVACVKHYVLFHRAPLFLIDILVTLSISSAGRLPLKRHSWSKPLI